MPTPSSSKLAARIERADCRSQGSFFRFLDKKSQEKFLLLLQIYILIALTLDHQLLHLIYGLTFRKVAISPAQYRTAGFSTSALQICFIDMIFNYILTVFLTIPIKELSGANVRARPGLFPHAWLKLGSAPQSQTLLAAPNDLSLLGTWPQGFERLQYVSSIPATVGSIGENPSNSVIKETQLFNEIGQGPPSKVETAEMRCTGA